MRAKLAMLVAGLLLATLVYTLYLDLLGGAVALAFSLAALAFYLLGEPLPAYTILALGVAGYTVYESATPSTAALAVLTLLAASMARLATIRGRAGGLRVGCTGDSCGFAAAAYEAASLLIAGSVALAALVASLALFHHQPLRLPYPLSTLFDLASNTVTGRVAGLAAVVAFAAYLVSELATPLTYALLASPGELARQLRRSLREAVARVVGWREWYHGLVYESLSLAGGLAEAAIIYPLLAATVSKLAHGELPLLSAALLWAASLLAGYIASRLTVDLLRGRMERFWKLSTLTGLASLALLAALLLSRGLTPAQLARVMAAPLTGGAPLTPLDLEVAPAILQFERSIRDSFETIEYIARFLTQLLWG